MTTLFPESLDMYWTTPGLPFHVATYSAYTKPDANLAKVFDGPVFAFRIIDMETGEVLDPSLYELDVNSCVSFQLNPDGTLSPFGTKQLQLATMAVGCVNKIMEDYNCLRRSLNFSKVESVKLVQPDQENLRNLIVQVLSYIPILTPKS